MEEIKLKVMPDGEVKIEVRGVKGDQCLKLTEFIEQELGLVVSREKTPEYFEVRGKTIEKEKEIE